MQPSIAILHSRVSIGESLAWTLKMSSFSSVAYYKNETELLRQDLKPLIILTDRFFYDRIWNINTLEDTQVILAVEDIDDEFVLEALVNGVADVIDLSKGPDIFVTRLEKLIRQETHDHQLLIRKLVRKRSDSRISDYTNYALTTKEKAILNLMREGVHLKLIAHKTDITYETVRTHMKRIYKKLGVMSASEAIIKAMKIDLG